MDMTGYGARGGIPAASSSTSAPADGGWPLHRLKKSYTDYLANKQDEINEQKDARRYYHSAQWTDKQIKALNARKQPVVTFNRIARKINGVVGLIERLRQDPKAYPRTPKHEDGAELATAVIRYVLDEQEWKAKSPECAINGAVDGIGGVEIEITEGDQGDNEVSFDVVNPDSFFYDPRSYKADFSDARYMGVGKWMDYDAAIEMFPDKADEISAAGEDSTDLTSDPDREQRWFSYTGTRRMLRVVDIWYKHKGEWRWALFTGSTVLMEGESYLVDEKGKTQCRYVMFSCNVDHDGDRYGFVRNMKSAQDELNMRRSKGLHEINTRRLILTKGAVDDVEVARREWARPDGVVEINAGDLTANIKSDDKSIDFAGQMKLMENAIAELENYGPNQALIGDAANQSGRAIALLQQAGMAELGPYILAYKGWKVRLYRAIWNAVQRHWSGERWVRVTDEENVAQFIQINGMQPDPMTGVPVLVNALGSLDVDIIIDEGADSVNVQADAYDTLTVMASKGAQIPPQVLIELAPLPGSTKKKLLEMMSQPDPMQQQAKQVALAGEAAKVKKTESETMLNMARAQAESMPDAPRSDAPQKFELPPDIQVAKAAADIEATRAGAEQRRAAAAKTMQDTMLAPFQMAQEASDRAADRDMRASTQGS